MIDFEIQINKEGTGFEKGFPLLKFLDEKYTMLHELNRCDASYIIDDVMPNLEKVLAGDLDSYEFGYDSTLIDFLKNKAVISYNFGDDNLEIGSGLVYNFMRVWCEYLVKWEKTINP